MNTKRYIVVIAVLVISFVMSGCGAGQLFGPANTPIPTATLRPEPTATFTPEPTATPVELIGILFLDANSSGLRDEASFICPADVAKPPSLAYFFPEAAECVSGEVVTIMEPGLAAMEVSTVLDEEKISATTDLDGIYRLLIPNGKEGQSVKLSITDPNANDVGLAMSYINQWNKAVVIPTYEINGVQVAAQHLNSTTIKPLNGIIAKVGEENVTGVMQGTKIFPFTPDDWEKFIYIVQGYDRDGKIGKVLNYLGETTLTTSHFMQGTGDGHVSYDYGSTGQPLVYATCGGRIEIWTSSNGSLNLRINCYGKHPVYSHLSKVLVAGGQDVVLGQVVGILGKSGTNWLHLDLAMLGDKKNSIRKDNTW